MTDDERHLLWQHWVERPGLRLPWKFQAIKRDICEKVVYLLYSLKSSWTSRSHHEEKFTKLWCVPLVFYSPVFLSPPPPPPLSLLSCRLWKQWVTAVNLSSIGTEHFPGVSTGSNHTAAITSRRHYIIYHPSWHQSPVVTAPQPRWHPCCLPTTAARSPHINISGSPGDTYKYFPQFHSVVRASKLPQPWSPSVRIRESESPLYWSALPSQPVNEIISEG